MARAVRLCLSRTTGDRKRGSSPYWAGGNFARYAAAMTVRVVTSARSLEAVVNNHKLIRARLDSPTDGLPSTRNFGEPQK